MKGCVYWSMQGMQTLARPMSRREFRNAVTDVASDEEYETNFKVDGLPLDSDSEYMISSYGISNTFMDEDIKATEAEDFRSVLDDMDVETFDVDSDTSFHWFGIRFPNVVSEQFAEFKEEVQNIVDDMNTDVVFTMADVTNTKSVRFTTSWDEYEQSSSVVKDDCTRIMKAFKEAGYTSTGGDVYKMSGFVDIVVHFDK